MKKVTLLLFVLVVCINGNLFAQLSGNLNIPGGYATILEAVTDLNTAGVGAGGVTFNIASGYTENITSPIILTATGTEANPITFQKSGIGANPKITRTDVGSLATSSFGGQGDAVIIIDGSDYVTFSEIDVAASLQSIEYGYYLRKVNGNDGCKFVNIRNAIVTMNKGTSPYVIGIYSSNNVPSSPVNSSAGVTVTSSGGRNENVSILGNTILNVHIGIAAIGYANISTDLFDQNLNLGDSTGGNIINNFGGGTASTSYGIFTTFQNNLNIGFNVINNIANGGTAFLNANSFGILNSNGINANCSIRNNSITLESSGTTSLLHGINNGAGVNGSGNNISIIDNVVTNLSYTTATTAEMIGIINTASASNITVTGNTVSACQLSGTGTFTGIDAGGTNSPPSTIEMSQNTVTNNIKTGASGSMFCIRTSGRNVYVSFNSVSSNGFSASSGTSACNIYGYYNIGSPPIENVFSNEIEDLYIAGTSTSTGSILSGIRTSTSGPITKYIYDNTVSNLSAISGQVNGIQQSSGANIYIYNNKVSGLTSFSSANFSGFVNGILLQSGNIFLYNNYIYQLSAPLSPNVDAVRGISSTGITSNSSIGIYYNTIYLNATSSGVNFGSSGIFHTISSTSTTSALDMRNNIIVNNSTSNGTGRTVAIRRSASTNLNNFAGADNNSLYAGTPGPSNLIFSDGTNNLQTLGAYKTHVAPRENYSFSELPPFINVTVSPYNLEMDLLIPTQTESGGVPVNSPVPITTDFFNNTRNISSPDVGAQEFNGTKLDLTPPIISYTALGKTADLGLRNIVATISDASGVPIAGIGLPVLYWSINNIAGPFTAVTGSYIAGNEYEFNFGSGVVAGDLVYYFIVAQDEVPTPNVGSIPSGGVGYTANPPTVITPPPTPNSYEILTPFSGIIPVGVGETYTSLTANSSQGLFKAINENVVTGDLIIQITSDLTETGAVFLNESFEEAINTISIVPSSASMKTISGDIAGGVLTLNGADGVVIDGSFMGSGRYLTIENLRNATNTVAIRLISLGNGAGATNNTIKNCVLKTGNIGTSTSINTFGIYIGGNSISGFDTGVDNNNNIIENNHIMKARYGIYARSSSDENAINGLQIINNEIGSSNPSEYITFRGLDLMYVEAPLISGNNIHDLKQSLSESNAAIQLGSGVKNSIISNNTITSIYSQSTSGYGAYGINFSSSSSVDNNTIVNNVISDIRGVNYSSGSNTFNAFGIRIVGGTNTKIYYNTINLFGDITIVSGAPTQPNSACIIVTQTSVTGLEVVNNILMNTQNFVSGSPKIYSIWVPTSYTGFSNINYNDYYGMVSSPPGSYFVGRVGITDRQLLSAWATFTGQDANSISANPNFVSTIDMTPNGGSPVLGAGIPITGITSDILGDTRSGTNPSIGAYENGTLIPIDIGISSVVTPRFGKIINANGTDVILYVKNFGTDPASDIDVFYDLNGGTPVGPTVITGPLAPGDSALVIFTGANQLTSMTELTGTVTVFTNYPGDSNANNNARSISNVILRIPPSSFPYFSDFSEPPNFFTGIGSASIWFISSDATNPNGTPNDNAAVAIFYSVSSGSQILRSTLIDLTGTTNPLLSFYRAYTTYLPPSNDALEVVVSTDGGLTWSAPLFARSWFSVPSLGTAPPQSGQFIPSSGNQWMHNLIDLSAFVGQEIVVGFNAITAFGNNLWIDNFKISDAENISLIPVNAPGLYGSLDTNGVQVNFTALRPGLGNGIVTQIDNQGLWSPEDAVFGYVPVFNNKIEKTSKDANKFSRSPSHVSTDASEGILFLSTIDDFPVNNVFETNLTATTFNGAIYTPDVIADRYWEISFSGDDHVSTSTYDVILDISTQLGITAYDSLYIVKRVDQNSPWVCLNTITEYDGIVPVRLISTGLTGFSKFGIASADGTLPVDLVEFNATVDRNNVTLNWTTAWEENNMKFDVQRRPVIEESATWQTVGSVAGNGTTQEQKSYSYLDRNLITGKYEYRLVQFDFDGNSTADHTLSSQVEVGVPTEFTLSQNYPNPFNPTTKIDFQIPVEGMTKLSIFDMSGREIATLVNESLTPGYYTYDFNATNIASGVYFYRLVSNNNVITKRAVLVK